MTTTTPNRLFYGDNLDVLRRKLGDASVDLCYIDPLTAIDWYVTSMPIQRRFSRCATATVVPQPQ